MNCMSNGHWTLSIEHWSMSIKHWALSIKHWALSIEHWALSIEHWALSIYHIRSIHKRPALFFLSLRRPTPTCWDKYYRKLYVQVYLHTCFETLYCRQFVALHFVLNCDCLASFLMSCILLPPAGTNITGNYTCRYVLKPFFLSTICGASRCLVLWLSCIFFNVLHPPPTCQNKYYRKLYM